MLKGGDYWIRGILGQLIWKRQAGASEVVKKSKRGRQQRSVWCVVYGEVMFKNRFGELQTSQWNLGRNKGYWLWKYDSSKSIGVPSCWCENHLRLQSFQLCCVLLGLKWFTAWEMWLMLAHSIPGGVVTAKPNKTQKRKRCIFIMGTVSKLLKKKIKIKQSRGDFIVTLASFQAKICKNWPKILC